MIVVLHNIRSIHNVGSIFRTADALGVKKIYLTGVTPSPLDEFGRSRQQFIKVSLGAEKTVDWERVISPVKLINKLEKDGFLFFAVEQSDKSIPYFKLHRRYKFNKIVLVLGNEVKGLSSAVLNKCDKILEIPMKGAIVRQAHHPRNIGSGKESLNVAISFAIVGYHLVYIGG